MLALNFGADVPLSQRASSADNFAKLVSGILDIGQANQPLTVLDIGNNVNVVTQGGKPIKVITPDEMGTSALTTALTDDGTTAASKLREGEVLMFDKDGNPYAVPQEQAERAEQFGGYTFR